MEYARVYVHEKGHEVTQANDPEDKFRDFADTDPDEFTAEDFAAGTLQRWWLRRQRRKQLRA
jgi:hypothetical protein